MTYTVSSGTLNSSIYHTFLCQNCWLCFSENDERVWERPGINPVTLSFLLLLMLLVERARGKIALNDVKFCAVPF